MQVPILLLALAATTLTSPFGFPLKNGFPHPSDQQIRKIQRLAGGTLPNSSPPDSVSDDTLTSLRLIAFNEISEVAFFKQLLINITTNVPGYDPRDVGMSKETLVTDLRAIKNQEELHALDANNALKHFGADEIKPCQYDFPVNNIADAINLAATFTDVVLGTLQAAQLQLAQSGDADLIPLIGSVIGQEGEQNGFYRALLGKVPSSSPFLTRSSPAFAFSALQTFIVEGSCPNIEDIDIPTFGALELAGISASGQGAMLTFTAKGEEKICEDHGLVYMFGQNVPVTAKIEIVECQDADDGHVCTFTADYPEDLLINRGLTIAAVTKGNGPFGDVDDVTGETLFGPGLIELN